MKLFHNTGTIVLTDTIVPVSAFCLKLKQVYEVLRKTINVLIFRAKLACQTAYDLHMIFYAVR